LSQGVKEEAQLWEQSYSYNEDDNVYELSVKGSKNKTDLDDTLFTALIINNQMSSVTESAFKSRMAEQMHVSEEQLANVSVEDIGIIELEALKATEMWQIKGLPITNNN
jgi:ATP-binding cassette subfamily B protein